MLNRSADATIRGFYYQFDTTIIKLLELENDEDSIKVEGIEDIDIYTINGIETVQCKYLSAKKCTHSILRNPIILMIDHFLLNKTYPIKYTVYAHFEDEIPDARKLIELNELKDILSYSEKVEGKSIKKQYFVEKNIADTDLESFLSVFGIFYGQEFKAQQLEIINKLKTIFNCNDFEAENHFYNNALKRILDLAIKKNDNERIINKKEFIDSINCGKKLFNAWYTLYRKHDDYLSKVKKNLKDVKALLPSKCKTIIIGENILKNITHELPLISFIKNLIDKYYKVGKVTYQIQPFNLVLELESENYLELKKEMIRKGIKFNDGYEHLDFSKEFFLEKPIINKKPNNKISKSSCDLKIISTMTLENNMDILDKYDVIILFSEKEYDYNNCDLQFIDIKYCNNLKDISKLIC